MMPDPVVLVRVADRVDGGDVAVIHFERERHERIVVRLADSQVR